MPQRANPARRTERTALVADDDPAFRLLLSAALDRLGFKATLVADGLAAIEQGTQRAFDLIILDVLMPGANGFEVCAALRANPLHRLTPVLILTGLEDHASVGEAFAAGASDFERKPVHVNLLTHRIRFLIKATDTLLELESKREALDRQATHDALTGLSNRAGLARTGERLIAEIADRRGLAALYIDLDGFKAVNDSYGHAFGDRLLREIVSRIREMVPKDYLVARVGGDEFVVLVDGPYASSRAETIATGVLTRLDEPFTIDEHVFRVGASIGMAAHPQHGATIDELVMSADAAMYRAKALGRRRFQAFDQHLALELLERGALQVDLRRALRNEEFEVHYQALFDLGTGRIEAAEALLRWNHPSRGLVDPHLFLPIAEKSGLMPAIGHRVLEHAVLQAARWCRPPFGLRHVSVNLSETEVRRSETPTELGALIARSGIEPGMLQIEVSEGLTSGMSDSGEALEPLRAISALGITLAIDDFGLARSSMSCLAKLPAAALKIDGEFIGNLLASTRDQAVVRAIIALGRSLGLTLIAEGIESREQMAWLHEAGCALGQGYAFSRPMSAAAFETLLLARQHDREQPSAVHDAGRSPATQADGTPSAT